MARLSDRLSILPRALARWALRLAACALLVLGVGVPAFGQELQPRIFNGISSSDFPTAGALLDTNGRLNCSGVMVGCSTFLTAAHCVCDENGDTCDPTESEYEVFLQHQGVYSVGQVTPHPSFIDFPSAANDIAVITLLGPIDGIRPSPLAATPPPFSTSATIVGFGTVNDLLDIGSGIKRRGEVVTTSCAPSASDAQFVCWDFTPPFGAPGTDSNTCPGDSGGPMFTLEDGQTVVAGVTSFGLFPCTGEDFAGDTNVANYASWVASVAGADLAQTSCGALPQVGDPDVQVLGFEGVLAASGAGSELLHSFEVPVGAEELRVTLNGQNDGLEDFDLWLRFGAIPTLADRDCTSESLTQFEVCRTVDPPAGTWYALARSVGGAGEYQVTATIFGAETFCGDSIVTAPEACDDGNTLSGDGCDAACQLEDVCGNGSVVSPETCDDGNTVPGDGCDAFCQTEPTVTGCPAVPDTGCEASNAKSKLKLKRGSKPGKDRLQWQWRKGKQAGPAPPGDLGGTDYHLCLYDDSSSAATLAFETSAPVGPEWSENSKRLRFKGNGTPGTFDRLQIGTKARTKLTAKAREIPSLPLSQDPSVVVQLRNDLGRCWESRFVAPARKSDDRRFFDRAETP